MISLEIIQPVDGADLLQGFADRPFLNPGSLKLTAGRKVPHWLPPVPGYVYAGTGGELYAAVSDATRRPIKVGTLADIVFGRDLVSRFSHTEHAGYIFATQEAKTLAACIEDDTELDLPADKAQRLIESGKRVYLSRNIINYALVEAVRIVGQHNERQSGSDGRGDWTMRRIFGAIT